MKNRKYFCHTKSSETNDKKTPIGKMGNGSETVIHIGNRDKY